MGFVGDDIHMAFVQNMDMRSDGGEMWVHTSSMDDCSSFRGQSLHVVNIQAAEGRRRVQDSRVDDFAPTDFSTGLAELGLPCFVLEYLDTLRYMEVLNSQQRLILILSYSALV
jgi:hypothetical protein